MQEAPYAIDVQLWGAEGIERILSHCEAAFEKVGRVEATRKEGGFCLTPTYRLLFRHMLTEQAEDVADGHASLLRFLRDDPELPPMRITLRSGRRSAIHEF